MNDEGGLFGYLLGPFIIHHSSLFFIALLIRDLEKKEAGKPGR
jgi:hypothetical protein